MKPTCYHCKTELNPDFDYTRGSTCSRCGNPTRCCMNCKHFDSTRYNECTEPVADRVVDKQKANFCDYFKPGSPSGTGGGKDPDAAKKAAEALFKKK